MHVMNPAVRAFRQDAIDDPDGFWSRAADQLPWFRKWDQVLDWRPPTFRWFVGGQTNLSYNCLDYHVQHARAGHAALIAEDERGGRRTCTYAQLLEEVKRTSSARRGLGVRRGDRVAVYMPPCPEALVLMLALTRIGAIHLVVFAGFGSGALADRVQLSGARWLFAADATWRKDNDVPLMGIVQQAVDILGELVDRVVVLKRTNFDVLRSEILATVRHELGPVAVISELNFVGGLPKTRSGKIMRRVLKAVATGADPGDISTIEDAGSVDDVRHAWQSLSDEISAPAAVPVG